MMFFYVETPTDKLVYGENECSTIDPAKAALRATRVQQFRDFLDARPNFKPSTLTGAALIAWNAVKTALALAGRADVLAHVVQRGETSPGVSKQITLATATYIAAWGGSAPNVDTLLGTFPASGIPFMGWPQTDVLPDAPDPPSQAALDAAAAAAAAKQAAQDQWRIDAQAQMALGIPTYQAWVQTHPYPL